MLNITPTQTTIISIILLILLFMLLFINRKQKRSIQDLQQELNKNINNFNQILHKYESLSQEKNQLDQFTVKVQTTAEGLQIRLTERDERLCHLEKELEEAQRRNEIITQNITELKEHFGIASAQAQNLRQQLSQSQQHLLTKEQEQHHLQKKLTSLSQKITELETTLSEKERSLTQQQQTFEQNKQQISIEFQNLANRILEEKTQSFNQTNQSALDTLLKPFREQIEGFQKRVNEIHSESLKGNAGLEVGIKKVLEIGLNMSQEANNLTSALKGEKKTIGNWGEMQLELALQSSGLVKDEHYATQVHLKNEEGKKNYPDFILNLPDNKHLIIDSKVSLNAYESAVSAEEALDTQNFLNEHIKAIKNHINDLHRKNYSNLIGIHSPDFVLMFIAIEPAYIEAMKQDKSLFNYGYERNVILVSHTTLMPILRTISNLWRIEHGNQEAREISERAGEIYNQTALIAERLGKLGNSLSAISGHYNSTVTALAGQQGLIGKVERFKELSTKANKTIPKLTTLHNNIEVEKLGL